MNPLRGIASLLLLAAGPARAHHGVASASFAGAEGPGAAFETTSALPLPRGALFVLAKTEYVRYQRFEFAEPENKSYASFNTLGVGVGIRSWLSAYLFQPWSVKAQDGVGTSSGTGDPSLLVALGFKWDEGLRLVPEKESLDELADWHFSALGATSLPLGSVSRRDAQGEYFEPEMQTGFGAPSATAGLAAMKQVTRTLTVLAEVGEQVFFPHTYAFTRYRFGAETRANGAVAWRAHAAGTFRLDLVGELNGLRIRRDEEQGASGELAPLRASGGAILYGGLGARVAVGSFGVGVGVRRAVGTALNERSEQQGSEGREAFRATASLSWSTGL